MSGKASFREGEHGNAIIEGVSTALSWLSILPVKGTSTFDRITGARVMAAIPMVGIVFGIFSALILSGFHVLGVSALLAATSTVIMWELLNRMMHLDGLADVFDALGSYAPPERAREILADPHTGLIGFSAALFSLLLQITAITSLISSDAAWLVCFIPALSRLGGQILARSGRKPLSPTGFGALLIGTVRWWWIGLWWLVLSTIAIIVAFAFDQGQLAWVVPVSGLIMCAFAEVLARHFSRRFNGVNGDCIGANVHISAAVLAVLSAILVAAMTTLSA